MYNNSNNLLKWVTNVYKKLMKKKYDYIFGNSQIIKEKIIGSSFLFSKASIKEHLLYYTNSDITLINHFIQLSLAN